MNFLAHCLIAARAMPADEGLSESRNAAHALPADDALRDGLIAGAILGDFVKGRVPDDWPEPLQAGIRLHRRIDAYSNSAAGVRQSCRRFPADLRRLAPVFVDIIADHCLAIDWPARHDQPLKEFSQRCYATLGPHTHRLDHRARRYLDWLIEEDLLAGYQSSAAMHRGLLSVTRRLRQEHLDPALLKIADAALPSLQSDFRAYFPDLLAEGRAWTQRHALETIARPTH